MTLYTHFKNWSFIQMRQGSNKQNPQAISHYFQNNNWRSPQCLKLWTWQDPGCQWSWARGDFAPQGTQDNVWRHFWSSGVWGGAASATSCSWQLVGRGQGCCKHRTASHNKEFSGPKHQQCQGGETLGLISNHKVTLSFEVNIMMFSPNSGRFYQPHSWRISGNIRINYFWSTSWAPSKPS